jgi:hypothetical protein
MVALTIDDAPHSEVTPYLLDELRRHGCRATFFCIGGQVETAPKALLRRMVDEGHELGNHMMHDMATYLTFITHARASVPALRYADLSPTHRIKLSPKEFETELLAVEELLDSFQPMHERPVKWFRPGCGTRPSARDACRNVGTGLTVRLCVERGVHQAGTTGR